MNRTSTSRQSVSEFRTHVGTIIVNARSSSLLMERISEYETGVADLNAVEEALEALVERANTFDTLKLRRDRVSSTLQDAEQAFRRGPFSKAFKHARYVFRSDAQTQTTLHLNTGIDNLNPRFPEWHPKAADFVRRIENDADLLDRMVTGPFTHDAFDALSSTLTDLEALYQEREQLSSERQQARRDRDAAREETQRRLSTFQDLAAMVLDDQPDLLEQLGFLVRSKG